MVSLTVDERDLLERIKAKEELQPFFFRKAKGLKWFDALAEQGYFEPASNPPPKPAREEGYVNVPFWPAIEYLVAASEELPKKGNERYTELFLDILRSTTKYAKEHGYGNYRTWWQFSKILPNIPHHLIRLEDIQLIDYWLDDPYDRRLVADQIGGDWLTTLLDLNDAHCNELALSLLDIIYRLNFADRKIGSAHRKEANLRIDGYAAKKITKKVSGKVGQVLRLGAAHLFQNRLEAILEELNNDKWSSVWRPAIEEHEQNHSADDAEDIIVVAYRDALLACVDATPPIEIRKYFDDILNSPFETVRRIALYVIDQKFQSLNIYLDRVITEQYFTSNFRHELWHFLRNHYNEFGLEQKRRVLDFISVLAETDEDEKVNEGATAYRRATWLSAIKDFGEDVAQFYQQCVDTAGTVPDNPDFSSYMTAGWVDHKSPIPLEELLSLEIPELVRQLGVYEDPGKHSEPSLEGLTKALRQAVKAEPLRFHNVLQEFSGCDLAFVYVLIEAYHELWSEKTQLPWDEIWSALLEFCRDIVGQDRFWSSENTNQSHAFVGNRHWIVGGIGRLIEAGTKSDQHAFSEKYLTQAEEILLILLKKETGEGFKIDSDAVMVAINSPRGHCIEALINLSLRTCRLSGKQHGNHTETWAHFQPIYDAELARADIGEYEFVTLVVNYLPNFLYMSKEWVMANLGNIFDQSNYQKWLCALQGYAYVGTVYEGVFNHLKLNGHLMRALDDENVKERVSEKVIQNIAVAFLNDFEGLEGESSLVHQLLVRRKYAELSHLIWFLWTLRKDGDDKLEIKVFELWPRILDAIDTSTREGRRLASKLCDWAVFVQEIDEMSRGLLFAVAPFADEDYNSYNLLNSIARFSEQQPTEAYELWLRLLDGARPDFPEEAIRAALTNLVRVGPEGLRKAKNIVSVYLKDGNEQPSKWLREIDSGAAP
ncbi:MAG TPA: hypothetical protein VMV78_02690 [Thiobacillus sp.]|nr:hypothetical protein [Thiobacillus sp.]